MAATVRWTGTVTALSSIAHGAETRGTITLLRREKVVQPDGSIKHVPIISGNAFRGVLRRAAEELLRDVLRYDGQLSLSAANALRSGGALARTPGPALSGQRLTHLRQLVPHVGVFGCAAGGRIIDGCLKVGKVVPHFEEVRHLLGDVIEHPMPAFSSTQLETYVRHDHSDHHDGIEPQTREADVPVGADGYPELNSLEGLAPADGSTLMMYSAETFPAGTTFSTWLSISRATPLEAAFFTDVLEQFSKQATLGGRLRAGHGHVRLALSPEVVNGADEPADWRTYLGNRREAAIEALQMLT